MHNDLCRDSLSLVQQLVRASADELESLLSRLQIAELIYEQRTIAEVEYVFKHALTQEVAYKSLLTERRRLLHERAGQDIEALFAGRLEDHLVALAHHYDCSGNVSRAVEYLRRAGNKMAQHGAHSDAVGYLTRSLEVIKQLPNGDERDRQEIDLQMALGRSLVFMRGWSAPEREPVLLRAQELCERLGDSSKLTEALLALAFFRLYCREFGQMQELAQRALALAEQAKAQTMIAAARILLGTLCFGKGQLEASRSHLECADEVLSSRSYRDFDEALYARMAMGALFVTLLLLGYLEAALPESDEMLTVARQRRDPYSLADALSLDANGRLFLGDEEAIVNRARELHSLAVEHGMPFHLARANFLRGWVVARAGRPSEGIEQMREAIADPKASGSAISVMIIALADACGKHGRVEDGLVTVAEGLTRADLEVVEAELYRLKGDLLLIQDPSSRREAERSFHTAIDIARRQGAKVFELRATVSLVRLMANQGRRDEARTLLAEIYNWFTEGFDTADLKEAKALLDELSH
jgi:tetratricopeptide (TPR) repeat protein